MGKMSNELSGSGSNEGPRGLGGWLILVGLGVCISPFVLAFGIYQVYVPPLASGDLDIFTDPASQYYIPFFSTLYWCELTANVLFVLWSAYLIAAFFMKKVVFPRSYQYFLLANLAFLVSDGLVSSWLMPEQTIFDHELVKDIGKLSVSCAIWVPYMNVSRRVKNTFVN